MRATKLALFVVFATFAASIEPHDCCGQETATWDPPASLDDLPSSHGLPEPPRCSNGEEVKTPEQWELRREELKAILQHFEYGHLPPRPDVVTGDNIVSQVQSDEVPVQELMEPSRNNGVGGFNR